MGFQDRQKAFDAGVAAGLSRVPVSHNPYPPRLPERRDWRRGWERGTESMDFLMNTSSTSESELRLDDVDDFLDEIELTHPRNRHNESRVLDCFEMMEAIDAYAHR